MSGTEPADLSVASGQSAAPGRVHHREMRLDTRNLPVMQRQAHRSAQLAILKTPPSLPKDTEVGGLACCDGSAGV